MSSLQALLLLIGASHPLLAEPQKPEVEKLNFSVERGYHTNPLQIQPLSQRPILGNLRLNRETGRTLRGISSQVTSESPPLPTTLPDLLKSGAYFQSAGEQDLKSSDLDFLEHLHLHYDLKKNDILQTHQQKLIEHQEKAAAKEQDALQQKTLTLRFWRREDKPLPALTTPSE